MAVPTRPVTVLLRERVPRDCRLARADVDRLLADHRAHVEVIPTNCCDRYRLTARGHVGTIILPTRRLIIRPKIPLANLFHLLDPANPPPIIDYRAETVAGTEALDFLAGRLAALLAERAAAGLHRGYAERSERGPFLQGRLDVAAQVRDGGARKDGLHCRFEEFTADVACNRVPKAVAELVLRSPLAGEQVRSAVRLALAGFDGITAAPLGPDSFAGMEPDPLTEGYRPLLDLCRLLADGLAPGGRMGATVCPAFLLDMERVFEGYLTRGITGAFAGRPRWRVDVQPRHVANRPVAGQPDIHLRPDVVLARDGRPEVVVDAKWKDLASSLMIDDVYQVLAYCTALGVGRGVLVYPGRRDRTWDYDMTGAPIRLTVRTLRVVGDREACGRSFRRLARALRDSASGQ
jgi:5-methylcytosine-specific restriction enzyme subunit McrC